MILDPALVALTLGQDFVFRNELVGGVLERLL